MEYIFREHIPSSRQITTGTTTVTSAALNGITGTLVDVEVDISNGLPSFCIVGLPDTAISEARDRVRSAIKNSGYRFPDKRVTVNLAPAHTKKGGSAFDAAIAIGILIASGQIQPITGIICGEVALDGRIRSIKGMLALLKWLLEHNTETALYFPAENSEIIDFIPNDISYPVHSISDIISPSTKSHKLPTKNNTTKPRSSHHNTVDFSDIIGQSIVKRAAEIAAAGHHHMLISGPPGVGKSMIANALPSILPELSVQERVESASIHSLIGDYSDILSGSTPVQKPHHSASRSAIVGGGAHIKPGAISLAHNGILFMDEIPEFRRDVLESLRQPFEEGVITISRASGKVTYPAQFLCIATKNPCPCGYYNIESTAKQSHSCTCSATEIHRYTKKLSGPLLNRIDIAITAHYIPPEELIKRKTEKQSYISSSATIREKVITARKIQMNRQQQLNGILRSSESDSWKLSSQCKEVLLIAMNNHQLSARSYSKTIAVARTIADLEQGENILPQHITEALSYTLGFSSL